MIYLDNAASTRPLPFSIDTMNSVLNETWGNPNSSHAAGEAAQKILDRAEAKIRACIGAKSGRLYFFPTATAAAQTAIYAACAAGYATIRYDTEHHSIGEHTFIQNEVCASKKANGYFLHCRMLANNETGEIYPAPKMQNHDIWLCDATAAMGHIPISVEQLGASYVVADALKFGGVPGTAFMWVADGAPYTPLVDGGTPPVALIAAMATALEWNTEHMDENRERTSVCWATMLEHLQKIEGMKYNTPFAPSRMNHILNVSFDGVDGKALAMLCSKRGVMISAGAACTSGKNEPSHVIMAMYQDEARARSAVRISFIHENTTEEVEQAAKIIAECVQELRAMA